MFPVNIIAASADPKKDLRKKDQNSGQNARDFKDQLLETHVRSLLGKKSEDRILQLLQRLEHPLEDKPVPKAFTLNPSHMEVLNDNQSDTPFGEVCTDCQEKYKGNYMKSRSLVSYSNQNEKIKFFT